MSNENWAGGGRSGPSVKVSISRGYIEGFNQDGKIQKIKGSGVAGTTNEDVDHMQPIGFSANAGGSDKTECLFLDMGGDASSRICLVVTGDREKHRMVGEGEASLYAPGEPAVFVDVTPGGINVEAAGMPVSIKEASDVSVECSGDLSLKAGGNITIEAGGTIQNNSPSLKHNAKEVGDTHGHETAPPGPPGPPV